jgi:hypothetical protein
MSRFYWQSDQHKKKYMLARWNIICQPKDQGGGASEFKILASRIGVYLVSGCSN